MPESVAEDTDECVACFSEFLKRQARADAELLQPSRVCLQLDPPKSSGFKSEVEPTEEEIAKRLCEGPEDALSGEEGSLREPLLPGQPLEIKESYPVMVAVIPAGLTPRSISLLMSTPQSWRSSDGGSTTEIGTMRSRPAALACSMMFVALSISTCKGAGMPSLDRDAVSVNPR